MNYKMTEEQKADWEARKIEILGDTMTAEAFFSNEPTPSSILSLLEIEEIAFFRKCYIENQEEI